MDKRYNKLSKRIEQKLILFSCRMTLFFAIFYHQMTPIEPRPYLNQNENFLNASVTKCFLSSFKDCTIKINQHNERINKINRRSIQIEPQIEQTDINFVENLQKIDDFEVNRNIINNNDNNNESCSQSKLQEFPFTDGLTRQQRRQGWIILHFVFVIYGCWLLATICHDYFVPVVKNLCIDFNLKADIIGATLMAAAASCSELFVNSVGTFVTEDDIGVGTVVGSAVFNLLAVPAVCGLFTKTFIHIDWWPITRDYFMYSIAVVEFLFILYDGIVMKYEALILIITYLIYLCVICCNDFIEENVRYFVSKYFPNKYKNLPYTEISSEIIPLLSATSKVEKTELGADVENYDKSKNNTTKDINNSDLARSPWKFTDVNIILFFIRWPITFGLWSTIPDCRKWPRLRYITLCLCIIWIGIASYLVAFLTTIIGDTLDIPDSVMGITLLSIGMSIPEVVSSIIVTKQGHGAMGICNSIGSNTFGILLCLGIPWFIRTCLISKTISTSLTTIDSIETTSTAATITKSIDINQNWIIVNSSGLIYSVSLLLIILFALYISFALNRFRLDHRIGITCTMIYFSFILLAVAIEINSFFVVNLPKCHKN